MTGAQSRADLEEWMAQGQKIRARAGFNDTTFESGNGTVATAWSGASDYSGPIDDREYVADSTPSGARAIADALNTVPVMERALTDVLELAEELSRSAETNSPPIAQERRNTATMIRRAVTDAMSAVTERKLPQDED